MRYLNCEECGRSLGLKMEHCLGKHYCADCLDKLISEERIVSDSQTNDPCEQDSKEKND